MRILRLKHALHSLLHAPGTGPDHLQTSMRRAPSVACDRK
jgi:hypothetical protein